MVKLSDRSLGFTVPETEREYLIPLVRDLAASAPEKLLDLTINLNIGEHTHHYEILDVKAVEAKKYGEIAYSCEESEQLAAEPEIEESEIIQLLTEQVAAANRSLTELRERLAETFARMKALDDPSKGAI